MRAYPEPSMVMNPSQLFPTEFSKQSYKKDYDYFHFINKGAVDLQTIILKPFHLETAALAVARFFPIRNVSVWVPQQAEL